MFDHLRTDTIPAPLVQTNRQLLEYQIKMEISPLLINELQDDDELKSQFNQLLNSIESIDDNSTEAEVLALNHHFCREVTNKPILARIANDGSQFLLWAACTELSSKLFHPAIKFLIEANPSALLWQSRAGAGKSTIFSIAAHTSHCVLMPWIANNYQWVLDHEICLRDPPAFRLVNRYVRRREATTGCTAAIIRQFFEAYPRGLTQVNEFGFTPLHLFGSAESEPDLFKWIADQCPSNMLKTDINGETPLPYACYFLDNRLGDNSSEICKYLIAKCPESVRIPSISRKLPIHYLLRCQHRIVKEVVVCLLREYPESYNMATSGGRVPNSIPFIQRIKPLLDEEMELKESVSYLQEVARMFQDAVNGTENPSSLASSTCDAFNNWATVTSIQRLEARMEQISSQLQDECNAD